MKIDEIPKAEDQAICALLIESVKQWVNDRQCGMDVLASFQADVISLVAQEILRRSK